MKEHNSRLEIVIHFLTIFVLLLKGIDKVMHAHWISGFILILLGLIVLALILFEKRLRLSHYKLKQSMFFIESAALFIIALVYYQEGKQYLQYVFAASAFAYLIAAFVHYKRYKRITH